MTVQELLDVLQDRIKQDPSVANAMVVKANDATPHLEEFTFTVGYVVADGQRFFVLDEGSMGDVVATMCDGCWTTDPDEF